MTKLIDKLSFLLTPNGYKTGSLYPYKPIENDSCYGFVPGISGNFFSTPDNINNTRARYVIRKSGSDWTLFCNGVQYSTGTLGEDLNTCNSVLYSGYYSNTRLHEYTEYNVALSDAQCLTLSQL